MTRTRTTSRHDVDHNLAYPEPPASPAWRHPKPEPLTPEQQRRNYELLAQAS